LFSVYETESEHESSTEAELVGVDDILSKMLWTKLFIEAHGHKVNMNVIYCDNTRAMGKQVQENAHPLYVLQSSVFPESLQANQIML
jgi:hypothetical protein